MKLIQILGTGCPKCHKLEDLTRRAATEIGLECEIAKVSDIEAIMRMGVLMTPGLAIDGKLVLSGRIPSIDDLKQLLRSA